MVQNQFSFCTKKMWCTQGDSREAMDSTCGTSPESNQWVGCQKSSVASTKQIQYKQMTLLIEELTGKKVHSATRQCPAAMDRSRARLNGQDVLGWCNCWLTEVTLKDPVYNKVTYKVNMTGQLHTKQTFYDSLNTRSYCINWYDY